MMGNDDGFIVSVRNEEGKKSRLRLPSSEIFYDEVINQFPVANRAFHQMILPHRMCSFYFMVNAEGNADFDMPYFVMALLEEVQKLQRRSSTVVSLENTMLMNYGEASNVCIGVCRELLFSSGHDLFIFAFRLCRCLWLRPDSARLKARHHKHGAWDMSIYYSYAELPLLWNLPNIGATQQLIVASYNRFAANVASPRELFALCTVAQPPMPFYPRRRPPVPPPTKVEWRHPVSPAIGTLLLDRLKSWGNADATIDRVEKARNWPEGTLYVSFLNVQHAQDHQHALFAIVERRALRIHWFCYKSEGKPSCPSVKQHLPIELAMN
jgi:hypothetical protein